MDRDSAVETVEAVVSTVESETTPVPVQEVWVYGDLALGLDPVERLEVYLTKDMLLRGDDPGAAEEFIDSHGVKGVGKTVRAEWAREHPEHLRANDAGHAAPERCLAAHLLGDRPAHLEVCNGSFEENVTARLEGALARDRYEEVLDPRGVCLYKEGTTSEEALGRLRDGDFVFPTLEEAIEMLGADPEEAERAATAIESRRTGQDGTTVRGDVV